ncbi:MAG: glycoside hydrolase family 15 protein [Thermoplasmata archaeon]|nr:glycoside hydrolase family 15 protein [Thermoplasmata archaeon]
MGLPSELEGYGRAPFEPSAVVARGAVATVPASGRTAYPPLTQFGVIGNLHTAALISRWGSIDWACFPRFASPSVFARLLDDRVGGFHELTPLEPALSSQAYLRATNVLTTRFDLPGGRSLELTDFMPVVPTGDEEGLPMIIRRVRATGGPVRVRLRCHPRFAYAQLPGRWRSVAGGHQARAGRMALSVLHPWNGGVVDGQMRAEGVVRPGAGGHVEIIWGSTRPTDASAEDLFARTVKFWRSWSNADRSTFGGLPRVWSDLVLRSELALKLLSHEDTGAFVAAPTTSLPEWPGGRRNWDYRYTWIRDAAFAAQTLLLLDHVDEAKGFLRWVVGRLRADPASERLRVVYGSHGEVDLTERSLPHLAGYADSRPVRVGNAAVRQYQLDIFGELLDAAATLSAIDLDFVRSLWTEIAGVVESVGRHWRAADHGIWEIRSPPRQYTHSKTMAWVALDRGVRIARRLRVDDERVVGWAEAADRVRTTILERGYHPDLRAFTQTLDGTGLDAAELRIPMVGLLPYSDPRVRSTVRRIRRELSFGPYVFRYRTEDGIAGAEGAFLPCSFWLVESLAQMGERAEAERRLRELTEVGGPLGLFAEACDPRTGQPLGNYPQALSHIALMRAIRIVHGRNGAKALRGDARTAVRQRSKVPSAPRRKRRRTASS